MKGKGISFPFLHLDIAFYRGDCMNRTIKRLIPLALMVFLSSAYILLLSKDVDFYRLLLSAHMIAGERDYIEMLLFWLVSEVALPLIFALYLYFILPRTEENGLFRGIWGLIFFAEGMRTAFTKTGVYRIMRLICIVWILWSLFQKRNEVRDGLSKNGSRFDWE